MASSALNEVIERFDVVDKLNNKGLVDLYSSGLDIISSFLSLSNADPRIAEQLAEPFDDPESKQEVYLLQKVAVLFELISEHVSNKVPAQRFRVRQGGESSRESLDLTFSDLV